jgi:Rod binding domain-containing protein
MSNLNGVQAAAQAATAEAARTTRLKKAAQEFESQMMSELLKPMQNDPLFAENDEGASATIQGMATQALGQAMAAQGGIGIAAKVLHSIRGSENKIPAVAGSATVLGGYSRSGKPVTAHAQNSLND